MDSQVIFYQMMENPALIPGLAADFLKHSEVWEIAEALQNFGSNVEFMQEFLANLPSCETLLKVFRHYRSIPACFEALKALVMAKANAEEIYLFMQNANGFATEDTLAAFFAANPDTETLRIAARGVFDSLEISQRLREAFFAASSKEQIRLFEFENSYRD